VQYSFRQRRIQPHCDEQQCSEHREHGLHPGVIDTRLLHIGFDATGDTVAVGAMLFCGLKTRNP